MARTRAMYSTSRGYPGWHSTYEYLVPGQGRLLLWESKGQTIKTKVMVVQSGKSCPQDLLDANRVDTSEASLEVRYFGLYLYSTFVSGEVASSST